MSELKVGQTVELVDGRIGVVRFLGQPHFASGEWVGVELEDDSGKNDGSVQGERYFVCQMGRGMFLRPAALTVIAQPAPAPVVRNDNGNGTAKRVGRPTSAVLPAAGRRMSSVPDSGAGKRLSMNAASPSPVPRVAKSTSRPSSILRSPAKSPTKQLGSAATSGTSTPRTGTPSNGRVPALSTTKARPSLGGNRTAMGPPPIPPSRTSRPSLSGPAGAGARLASGPPRPLGGRPPIAPRLGTRLGAGRINSLGAQTVHGQPIEGSGHETADEESSISPGQSDPDALSPKPLSPALSRTLTADRLNAQSANSARSSASPISQRGVGDLGALKRESEDLKAKLRVMEKKRMEDRDKLKALEKVQDERSRFENIIQKLQAKYQPQQQEITELRKQLIESAARFEEVENMQAEHDVVIEMATLDREMAEETAEVLKTELESLRLKAEELELEVEILREENTELSGEMSPEERASQGWLQMERNNERLREALLRLRDMTQQQEADLKDQIKSLEEDVRDLSGVKHHYESAKEKLAQSEAGIEDLRQQLDNALGAEDMIEELTEKNMSMSEQIEELRTTIEDLESLKELNDELEINHIETEKEMQEEIDFKDSIISEQARRAAHHEETAEEMEYTLSKFRELVASLQTDLEDMKASHAVTETESEQLNSRSRAMLDLNMKLQVSAAKTQVKTLDLELRRLDAQQASDHLAIVQLFLPEAYNAERDSVLALLRFKRVGFKANMLHSFVKERISSQGPRGNEDDVFAGCDVLDKLTWISAMCDRFVSAISHCTGEQFAKFEGAVYELEPVERALNAWVDGLRRDELKEKQCASELQRTIAVMSHLAEVHIPESLASYADDVHMRALVMQSRLENTAAALASVKTIVQTIVPEQSDEDEVAQDFSRKADAAISQVRSAKVIVGKAVRSLEDLKSRSLSLMPDTIQNFDECEAGTDELSSFSQHIGENLYNLLHEEGRAEPFTYNDVQSIVNSASNSIFQTEESGLFSAFSQKLRFLTNSLTDLAGLTLDLSLTLEFERTPLPWVLRAEALKSTRTIPVDTAEELRRVKEESHERARLVAMRDQTLEEASVKIETLESRVRDAIKKNERIAELEAMIEEAKAKAAELGETIESQSRELNGLEGEREQWVKMATDSKARGDAAAGAAEGQERAVATAREMNALKEEISSLQTAVCYLREDNRLLHLYEPEGMTWLHTPLLPPKSAEQKRKELLATESEDVLNELLTLVAGTGEGKSQAKGHYSLKKLVAPREQRFKWRPLRQTLSWNVARQREEWETWRAWRDEVIEKSDSMAPRDPAAMGRGKGTDGRTERRTLATIGMRLPALGGVKNYTGGEVQIVTPGDFDEFRGQLGII